MADPPAHLVDPEVVRTLHAEEQIKAECRQHDEASVRLRQAATVGAVLVVLLTLVFLHRLGTHPMSLLGLGAAALLLIWSAVTAAAVPDKARSVGYTSTLWARREEDPGAVAARHWGATGHLTVDGARKKLAGTAEKAHRKAEQMRTAQMLAAVGLIIGAAGLLL